MTRINLTLAGYPNLAVPARSAAVYVHQLQTKAMIVGSKLVIIPPVFFWIQIDDFHFELLAVAISRSRRIIPFGSGSCLSKLERVKANSIKIFKIVNKNHVFRVHSSHLGPVRFYTLLFASSCRSKRNYPGAEMKHTLKTRKSAIA